MTAGGNMLSAMVEKKKKKEKAKPHRSESSAWDLFGGVTRILVNISRQLISCTALHTVSRRGRGLVETNYDGCSVAWTQ